MSARHQPPPAVGGRATLATVAVMAGTVAAHSWAGGAVPPAPWLVGVAALVLGASVAVFRGTVSGPVMFVALGAGQLGLHAALMLLAGAATHDAGAHRGGSHVMAGSHSVLDLLAMDWQMAVAHGVSAVFTAVMWSVVARALDALERVPEHGCRGVSRPKPARCPTASPDVVPAPWLTGAPRRGPPYAALPHVA